MLGEKLPNQVIGRDVVSGIAQHLQLRTELATRPGVATAINFVDHNFGVGLAAALGFADDQSAVLCFVGQFLDDWSLAATVGFHPGANGMFDGIEVSAGNVQSAFAAF